MNINRRPRSTGGIFLALAAFSGVSAVPVGSAFAHDRTYEITITNITRGSAANAGAAGQILNGLVVATHNSHFRLFTLGAPVRDDLALLAEDALNASLVASLTADPNVKDVQHIGIVNPPTIFPIAPGASVTLTITADGEHRFLSLAAMLVTTNDAFAALNGVLLPREKGEFFAVAYDAGSEVNDELCANIPGPPCGSTRRVGGGEGYVSVHSGVHGIGDLVAADRDWRNPVAWITVRRVH